MTTDIQLQKRNIDVVHSLGAVEVVGRYRGEEIWCEIEKQMEEVPAYSMILIDIRSANPLQYEFCQYAFGPLFNYLIEGRWSHKHVIFQMYDFHKPGFFRGVLKHLGTELDRKESEKRFISAGYYTKLIIGDINSISFLGKLSKNQDRVLNLINEMKEATARQVIDKLKLSEENVVDILRLLKDKSFIFVGDTQNEELLYYYSFYKYF